MIWGSSCASTHRSWRYTAIIATSKASASAVWTGRTIRAESVILCSGGFQASAELRARYMGATAATLKVLGSRYNTGEVLLMALQMGAAAAGDWSQVDASSVSPTPMVPGTFEDTYRRGYQFGITVNRRGQRFMDEGPSELATAVAGTRTAMSRIQMELGYPEQVMAQPGGLCTRSTTAGEPLLDEYYARTSPPRQPRSRNLRSRSAWIRQRCRRR